MGRSVITTAIPYVNGHPHVGHALELVRADVLARHRRLRGHTVRAQTGTDDNALKNVRSAAAAGLPTAVYVSRVADRFAALGPALELSFDDFLRTGSDPRHRPGAQRLWAACAANGDLYRRDYTGRYCVGCELFYTDAELVEGRCPEHGTPAETVAETNWFFRLGRYRDTLRALIGNDVLRVEPATRKREVLAFLDSGLDDFSVSRSVERANGWGIGVPGDPDQVMYVWFDALANYLTGPGYGTDDAGFRYWWQESDERLHVIGKGIIRFHAVYWPAMLLSAGLRLPDTIAVHEYLTADGAKIAKSAGTAVDPADLVARFGPDPLRWWLVRAVADSGDTDFTVAAMVARANEDLANNLGNLVNRTVSMVHRYRGGVVPDGIGDDGLHRLRVGAGARFDAALARFDLRRAAEVVLELGHAGNRYVESARPWQLAADPADARVLDGVLAELVATCREIAARLTPLLPGAAQRLTTQLGDAVLPPPVPVFSRRRV